MEQTRRNGVKEICRWAAEKKSEGRMPEQMIILGMMEDLPRVQREVFCEKILKRKSWSELSREKNYSERQLRRFLHTALEALYSMLLRAHIDGEISGEIWQRYFD